MVCGGVGGEESQKEDLKTNIVIFMEKVHFFFFFMVENIFSKKGGVKKRFLVSL